MIQTLERDVINILSSTKFIYNPVTLVTRPSKDGAILAYFKDGL